MTHEIGSKKSLFIFALAVCAFSFSADRAQADQPEMLKEMVNTDNIAELAPQSGVITMQRIEDFYAASIKAQLEGKDKNINFLQKHMHEDVKVSLNMTTIIHNGAPKTSTVISDKTKIISDTKDAFQKGYIKSADTQVKSAEIAEDGQFAKVSEFNKSEYILSLSESEKVLIRTEQLCDSEVVLTNDVLQTKAADCKVKAILSTASLEDSHKN